MKRTKAVVDPTTAKKATPNTSAEIASNSGEWPKIGNAAPIALTPRIIMVVSPPRSSASTRRHTHGVANALTPIRPQNVLCAAAPPPPSRT